MELHPKLEVKEVAQEQTRHLTQEIQSTTTTEAYETQNYLRKLLAVHTTY